MRLENTLAVLKCPRQWLRNKGEGRSSTTVGNAQGHVVRGRGSSEQHLKQNRGKPKETEGKMTVLRREVLLSMVQRNRRESGITQKT